MKKILLITLILLLQSFSSFGKINDKGLICKCIDCERPIFHYYYGEDKELGFLFKNNKVTKYDFITDNNGNTTWRVFWYERDVEYKFNHLRLGHFSKNRYNILNRSNLSLRVFEDYTKQKIVKIYQCRILKNEKSFFNELDLLKNKYNESNRDIKKNRKL